MVCDAVRNWQSRRRVAGTGTNDEHRIDDNCRAGLKFSRGSTNGQFELSRDEELRVGAIGSGRGGDPTNKETSEALELVPGHGSSPFHLALTPAKTLTAKPLADSSRLPTGVRAPSVIYDLLTTLTEVVKTTLEPKHVLCHIFYWGLVNNCP